MKLPLPFLPDSLKTGLGGYLAAVFTLSSLFLTLVLVSVIGFTASGELKRTIGTSLAQRALYSSEKLDSSMYERYREVENLARRMDATTGNLTMAARRDIITQVQNTYPYYAWIGITDPAGNVLAATKQMLEGHNVAKKNWFTNEAAGIHVHDVHEAKLLAKLIPSKDNEPMRFVDIAFAYHDNDGNKAGILGAHLSWEWSKETRGLIMMDNATRTDFLIVSHDGKVLLGPPDLQGKQISTASFAAAKLRKTGFLEEIWPDGRSYLVGYSKTSGYRTYPGLGWTVLTRQDAASAYAPVQQLQAKVFWIGMTIALLFSVMGLFIARRISKPMMQVAQSAKDIESGQATALIQLDYSYYEAEILSSALNSLLQKLQRNEHSLTEMNLTLESRVIQRTNELQAERSLLNTVLDSIDIGVVACNEHGWLTLFNSASRDVLGDLDEALPPESWSQHYRLFEPDGAMPLATENNPLLRTLAGDTVQDVEMVVVPPHQPPRLLVSSGRRLRDDQGRNIGAVIVFTDITQRREVEQALAENAKLLRTITNGIPARVSYIDAKMRYRFSNAHYAVMSGHQSEQLIGKNVREVFGEQVYASHAPHMTRALRGECVAFDRQVSEQDTVRYLHYEYTPDMTETGRVMGFFALITDVTEIKRAEEQMRLLARIDNLTGLPNRAQFQERLTQAMARSQRNDTLMGLLFLDIDKFKSINDTLGHRGGDLVLKEFGQRLQTCIRKTDMVARLAGDEFVIILEGMVSAEEATVVAQKIVDSMQPIFTVGDMTWQVSTSIGIALREQDNHDGERLLHHADEALYAAKAAGRNTYRLHA